ncbi:hypothetical protein EYF80_000725 [Liparis tanakae]|uniref:Uncharacterized protein n=1 Tax=Liparis tanakae TaxID=230148 RepID=A0A4Z2JFT3_9TELE|nr:hypothetical protein EYF80_000725 [Liparis tanakae]
MWASSSPSPPINNTTVSNFCSTSAVRCCSPSWRGTGEHSWNLDNKGGGLFSQSHRLSSERIDQPALLSQHLLQYPPLTSLFLSFLFPLKTMSYNIEVNEKNYTSLPARSISKQVFDNSHGSVRASQHILKQQLVREHLQQ